MTLMLRQPWEYHLLALAEQAKQTLLPAAPARTADEMALAAAYDHCEALTAQHSRSFYTASRLLPVQKRRYVRALYAFCRSTDDIVDCPSDNTSQRLDAWRERTLSWRADESDFLVLAWRDMCRQATMPLGYASQLIDGVARDLEQTRYATFDELVVYCYGVASTVGLMSMHILGYESEEATPYAIKLGVALQLTNILRDVAEDWQRGRLYLPLDELAEFGLSEDDIAQGQTETRMVWRPNQIALCTHSGRFPNLLTLGWNSQWLDAHQVCLAAPLRFPQVPGLLGVEPERGRVAKQARQAQSHQRGDRPLLAQQLVNGLARHSQRRSQRTGRQSVVRHEVLAQHLARMRRWDQSWFRVRDGHRHYT